MLLERINGGYAIVAIDSEEYGFLSRALENYASDMGLAGHHECFNRAETYAALFDVLQGITALFGLSGDEDTQTFYRDLRQPGGAARVVAALAQDLPKAAGPGARAGGRPS